MDKNTTNEPKVNAGSMMLQKTNEDFNKKIPIPETEADVKESSPYIYVPVNDDDKNDEDNGALQDEE